MTDTLVYGIRYTAHDKSTVVTPIGTLPEAKDALAVLLYEQGLAAEIVSSEWKPEKGTTLQAKRNLIENVLDLVVSGEITHEEAAAQLQYFPSGLLSDKERDQRRADGHHVADDCTMATWIERAVNIHAEYQKPAQDRDRSIDDEALDIQRLGHLDVLAGEVDHGGNTEFDCPNCARRVTVKAVA